MTIKEKVLKGVFNRVNISKRQREAIWFQICMEKAIDLTLQEVKKAIEELQKEFMKDTDDNMIGIYFSNQLKKRLGL